MNVTTPFLVIILCSLVFLHLGTLGMEVAEEEGLLRLQKSNRAIELTSPRDPHEFANAGTTPPALAVSQVATTFDEPPNLVGTPDSDALSLNELYNPSAGGGDDMWGLPSLPSPDQAQSSPSLAPPPPLPWMSDHPSGNGYRTALPVRARTGMTYTGTLRDGMAHGEATIRSGGASYKGQFFRGEILRGIGVYTRPDGVQFHGEYEPSRRPGGFCG